MSKTAVLGRLILGRGSLGRGVAASAATTYGYLDVTHLSEEDYGHGTGAFGGSPNELNWSTDQSALEAGDIFLLALECEGGEKPTGDFGDWTLSVARESGSGSAHAAAAIFLHRYDGVTLPVINPLLDTGDHNSWSLHVIRNVERTTALASFITTSSADATGDVNVDTVTANATADGVSLASDDSQECHVFFVTGGAKAHGGVVALNNIAAGWLEKQHIRESGHASGSGGSHITCSADTVYSNTTGKWYHEMTQTMRSASVAVYLPAHRYANYVGTVTDGVGAADVANRGFIGTVADSLAASDAAVRALTAVRSVADSLNVVDNLQEWLKVGTYAFIEATAAGALTAISVTVKALTDITVKVEEKTHIEVDIE